MTTKNDPLISVIITNYNYAKYVGKAIESVYEQTYKRIELIIIDDGSTDNSDTIIKKALEQAPSNIRGHYVTQKNLGISYARNKGIDMVSGEFFCFLDADDYFNPSYIENSYRYAKKTKADVVYPNWRIFNAWNETKQFPAFNLDSFFEQKIHIKPESLVRTKAVGRHRFDLNLNRKVAEDWDFFLGLALNGAKIVNNPTEFVNYRVKDDGRAIKNGYLFSMKTFYEILQKWHKLYPKKVNYNLMMEQIESLYKANESLWEQIGSKSYRLGRMITEPYRYAKLSANAILRATRRKRYQLTGKEYTFSVPRDSKSQIAVIIHLYYIDLWEEIRQKLVNLNRPFDLFISVVDGTNVEIEKISNYHANTTIVTVPNRGRDVLPFLMLAQRIAKTGQYVSFLKIHTKKSKHRSDGSDWFHDILDELLPENTQPLFATLSKLDTGVIGPSEQVVSLSRYMGDNFAKVLELTIDMFGRRKAKTIFHRLDHKPFFGGTMFWCRVDYLKPLLSLSLMSEDFEEEDGQIDKTTAHAVERVLGGIMHVGVKKMYTIQKTGAVEELTDKSYTGYYKHTAN